MSQTRRAATSITANLAEGYGRFANKDREHFYVIARGSLYELDSHIQIARDLNYLDENEHKEFVNLQEDVSRLLSAFIRTHRANNK